MSKWNIVYCVTKKLSQSTENFNIILYCLSKSIEFASKFHNVKIITDIETIEYLKSFNVEKEVMDFGYLRFLDDIKISVLPHIKKNEILVDPDVFIFDELKIDTKCDLLAERQENITDSWYIEDYNLSKKFKFSKYIKLESKTGFVTNIGILKFFNTKFLEKYIETYHFVRSIALEEEGIIDDFPRYSVLFGQLLLQNIVDKNNFKVSYSRLNKKNTYYHLAGAEKYEKSYLEKILKRKSQKTAI